MIKPLHTALAISGFTLFLSSVSLAAGQTCTSGNITRQIDVVHDNGDPAKACEVRYLKPTEKPGEAAAVLWRYEHEIEKCQQHADGLAEKLTGFGFTCAANGAAAATAEPEAKAEAPAESATPDAM